MNVTVIGAGYVGLGTAACLAELGHQVVGVDRDHGRVALLQAGGGAAGADAQSGLLAPPGA